ncbi:MAG TPA: undecaprenyl-diphosphate phosphatase, partial [Patescibacteria group bacterium]|nr:undecaprenyl-diphosphate phosphatase [Patescibacteria group bacterium]
MDTIIQALVMGIVQGLTEFLPVSSSGHLIIVPWLFGWDDAFITSLAFSVMLHLGTLIALLVYFRDDWLRLIPAGFATIRDRGFDGNPDRKLAWLLVAATIPAAIVGALFSDF